MRLLQIHNHYRFRGGEDSMFEQICAVLRENGHDVSTYEKRSQAIIGLSGKLKAALSGIYSPASKQDIEHLIRRERPDLAHVHNLYPLISPSVLTACKERGIPTVMRCPNYRLVCPTGIHLRNGKPCDLCRGGREYRCAFVNCRGSRVESIAMASRSYLVRKLGLIQENVSLFVAPSECVRQRLVEAGISKERIHVVPNMVDLPAAPVDASSGEYVAFAGRLSPEKGIETLIAAARLLPHVPVRIAGEGILRESLARTAPPNVVFAGHLDKEALASLYAHARVCVVPSIWHEAFGLVAAEAMAIGLPVVASRMGALPEIVDESSTGYLFAADDPGDLAAALERLWAAPQQCSEMGLAGREKVRREYTRDVYYSRLMRVYEHVLSVPERACTSIEQTAPTG